MTGETKPVERDDPDVTIDLEGVDRSLTERINPRTAEIDTLPAAGIVRLVLHEDRAVVPAVEAEAAAIGTLAQTVAERMHQGGRLIYAGAGTSGRLGVLDAAECPPTYGIEPGRVVGLIAGGPKAMTGSVEAAEDREELGAAAVDEISVGPNDVVVGIAASGRTPYAIGAVREAKRRGAFTAGIACTRPSALEEVVDLMIAPIVGPEVISGSTRMKAGTAQKLVLNSLSTTVMVLLGKTYGNLMVDVQPTNAKLRRRAVNLVATATGLDKQAAAALLEAADREIKSAIVMELAGVDLAEARQRLSRSRGRVRQALDLDQTDS